MQIIVGTTVMAKTFSAWGGQIFFSKLFFVSLIGFPHYMSENPLIGT